MNILITGAYGFVGKNLTAALKNVMENKDKAHSELDIGDIYLYDVNSSDALLEEACQRVDFVFNLAGINRPQNNDEFMKGNRDFAARLLDTLKKHNNKCPVMLSSSIQATLESRYAGSEYGKSKKAGEEVFFEYAKETGAKVLVYRFPNLFGKWGKPNYNSVVATFCHNLANDFPITINDRDTELELVYIDDLIDEMFLALKGQEHRCNFSGAEFIADSQGKYCFVPISHKITLGKIADLLQKFKEQPQTLEVPEIPADSFEKKLYSTYLAYLPKDKVKFPLKMHTDERGSFTELLRSSKSGQVSINISKPGVVKGQHWHHSKCEFFIVVAGHGLIQMRKIDSDEIISFEVSGEKIEAVCMLPGYTHNIINLSETEDLITVMWANEGFEPEKPDTFREEVDSHFKV